jgi:hypothetical protein
MCPGRPVKFHDMFHDMFVCFTICLFISPDLDGNQEPRHYKNVPRETHKGG